MDSFRDAAACACFLGIIFSLISNILPSEKFSKQIQMLFALVMIISVTAKLNTADIDLSVTDPINTESAGYENGYENYLNRQIQEKLCSSLEKVLEENGIDAVNISVIVNNSSDGSISINQAEIILENKSDLFLAEKVISEALGKDVVLKIKTKEDG